MNVSEIFEKRLKRLREKKAVSQKEVAEAIGVKAQTISGYESGRTKPPLDIAAKLAKYFGASLDWMSGICEDAGAISNRQALYMLRVMGYTVENPSINVADSKYFEEIKKYFEDSAKMKKFLQSGDIDQDVYDYWEQKVNSAKWLDEPFVAKGE